MPSTFFAALSLSTLAGLATGLGGLLAVLARRIPPRAMAAALGFSAGIMLALSLADLLPHAMQALSALAPSRAAGALGALGGLLLGALGAALLDSLLPSPARLLPGGTRDGGAGRLLRLGLLSALAMVLHNLPEGMATFMSGCADLSSGAGMALAVALHNIPEGMVIALPLYGATGRRAPALAWALAAGLSEPLGALLAWGLLGPFLSPALLAWLLALIAGIMTDLAVSQILPAAWQSAPGHYAEAGAVAGVLVMALLLFFFA